MNASIEYQRTSGLARDPTRVYSPSDGGFARPLHVMVPPPENYGNGHLCPSREGRTRGGKHLSRMGENRSVDSTWGQFNGIYWGYLLYHEVGWDRLFVTDRV